MNKIFRYHAYKPDGKREVYLMVEPRSHKGYKPDNKGEITFHSYVIIGVGLGRRMLPMKMK